MAYAALHRWSLDLDEFAGLPESMSLPRFFHPILIITLCIASTACGGDAVEQDAGDRAIPVTTTTLRQQPWSDTIRALGTVTARESVMVTAKVSETVEDVLFDSGDEVEIGDPLITLSGRQQRAALAEAQAAANEAEQLYERQSELAEQQLIARSTLDTQRAMRDAARARVAQIQAQLGERVIRAPFSGVLGLRQVSPGSLVTPGTPIATLDDLSRVYVDFPVPEAMLSKLAPGQRLVATSTAFPDREFAGVVATIAPRIDPTTRAIMVRGEFPNTDGLLRPGLLMQVVLSQPDRPALLLPEISVVQVGNSSYVYRLTEEQTVERVDIQIGARRDGMAEVVSGLEAGDVVVVDGTGKLAAGDRVSAEPNEPFVAPGEDEQDDVIETTDDAPADATIDVAPEQE